MRSCKTAMGIEGKQNREESQLLESERVSKSDAEGNGIKMKLIGWMRNCGGTAFVLVGGMPVFPRWAEP